MNLPIRQLYRRLGATVAKKIHGGPEQSCRILTSAPLSADYFSTWTSRQSGTTGEITANGVGNATPQEADRELSSLPLAQRCKNILASNWRGQLSTVKAGSDQKDGRSVHGSLVQYVLLDGKPIVWLPGNDSHQVNLLLDDRGSLLVGQADPQPLVSAFRQVGKTPPRTILLGDFVHIEESEMDYLKRRIQKQVSAAQAVLDRAGPNLQEILTSAGDYREERTGALEELGSPANKMKAYRLYARSCHYVDVMEGRHTVTVGDVVGAATDPLVAVHAAVLEGVNRSSTKRRALMLFCAAYLQVQAQDAYMFSADRWGFNVLAQPSANNEAGADGGSKAQSWREFRFAFSREIKDVEGFCIVLKEMEKEVMAAVEDGEQGEKVASR